MVSFVLFVAFDVIFVVWNGPAVVEVVAFDGLVAALVSVAVIRDALFVLVEFGLVISAVSNGVVFLEFD